MAISKLNTSAIVLNTEPVIVIKDNKIVAVKELPNSIVEEANKAKQAYDQSCTNYVKKNFVAPSYIEALSNRTKNPIKEVSLEAKKDLVKLVGEYIKLSTKKGEDVKKVTKYDDFVRSTIQETKFIASVHKLRTFLSYAKSPEGMETIGEVAFDHAIEFDRNLDEIDAKAFSALMKEDQTFMDALTKEYMESPVYPRPYDSKRGAIDYGTLFDPEHVSYKGITDKVASPDAISAEGYEPASDIRVRQKYYMFVLYRELTAALLNGDKERVSFLINEMKNALDNLPSEHPTSIAIRELFNDINQIDSDTFEMVVNRYIKKTVERQADGYYEVRKYLNQLDNTIKYLKNVQMKPGKVDHLKHAGDTVEAVTAYKVHIMNAYYEILDKKQLAIENTRFDALDYPDLSKLSLEDSKI